MKILVTGASGFIGSFIIEEGLRRGHEMWAGVRATSSKEYLTGPDIHFITLDMGRSARLREQLSAFKAEHGGWDYVVHAAGATKSATKDGFFKANTECTKHLADELIALDMVPRKFLFMSSLSVFGAIREQVVHPNAKPGERLYAPIKCTDVPHPNTLYGESKYYAERYLKSLPSLPLVILRPTGVYGPREKDYFLMAQSIARHVDFAVGYTPQEITFVYVLDLVQAVFLALEKAPSGAEYFVSDGAVYSSTQFSDLIRKELGDPFMVRITAPQWMLRMICKVNGSWAARRGCTTTLNQDKYHILSQRHWQCDIEPLVNDLGYRPQYTLERGVKESIAWYKKEGWL